MKKLLQKLAKRARFTEKVDPKPAGIPVGFQRPPTLQEQVQRFIRHEMSQAAANGGLETWEEADDFDVGDDYDPSSPHELVFDPELGKEITKDQQRYVAQSRKKFDEEVVAARKKQAEKPEPKAKKKGAPPPDDDDQE